MVISSLFFYYYKIFKRGRGFLNYINCTKRALTQPIVSPEQIWTHQFQYLKCSNSCLICCCSARITKLFVVCANWTILLETVTTWRVFSHPSWVPILTCSQPLVTSKIVKGVPFATLRISEWFVAAPVRRLTETVVWPGWTEFTPTIPRWRLLIQPSSVPNRTRAQPLVTWRIFSCRLTPQNSIITYDC